MNTIVHYYLFKLCGFRYHLPPRWKANKYCEMFWFDLWSMAHYLAKYTAMYSDASNNEQRTPTLFRFESVLGRCRFPNWINTITHLHYAHAWYRPKWWNTQINSFLLTYNVNIHDSRTVWWFYLIFHNFFFSVFPFVYIFLFFRGNNF